MTEYLLAEITCGKQRRNIVTKYCPIMSYQKQNYDKVYCIENQCTFWDEEREQCCIKSLMIAVAGKKDGDSSSTAQAYYIPPSSYYQANAVSDIHFKLPEIDNS